MPEYIQTKTILSKLKGAPDPYFGITYNMNLYRGCQHQCIYCDSRSEVYRVGDFSHIRIKENAPELLEKALIKMRIKGTIGTGSMNDPYMPIEAKEQLTKRALQIIADFNYPIHVLTKSTLVVRDAEILKSISKQYAAVSFTITAADDRLAHKIEPAAPLSTKRFEALNILAKDGIYTGLLLTPVLPYITDTIENIRNLVDRAVDNGAGYIIGWMGMTQRKGQREHYYQQLSKLFPGLQTKYQQRYGNQYSVSPENSSELSAFFKEYCGQKKISTHMQFFRENKPEQLNLF